MANPRKKAEPAPESIVPRVGDKVTIPPIPSVLEVDFALIVGTVRTLAE